MTDCNQCINLIVAPDWFGLQAFKSTDVHKHCRHLGSVKERNLIVIFHSATCSCSAIRRIKYHIKSSIKWRQALFFLPLQLYMKIYEVFCHLRSFHAGAVKPKSLLSSDNNRPDRWVVRRTTFSSLKILNEWHLMRALSPVSMLILYGHNKRRI